MSGNWRTTAFSAALFLLVGANLPYLPVWLEEGRGFTGTEISAIAALSMLIRIVAGPVLAARTERAGLARVLLQVSCVLVLAYGLAFPGAGKGVTAALLVGASIGWGAVMPLTEALLLEQTREGRPGYGVARAISSAAFIFASLVLGGIIASFGPESVRWWLIGASGLMIVTGTALPAGSPDHNAVRFTESLQSGFALYRHRRILLAGLGSSFVQAAHAYYYNLGSNIWISQGIPPQHIGALWSVGVALEVVLLVAAGSLFRRWTPGAIMLLGAGGAVLRWCLTSLSPPLAVLYAVQCLHGLSFAATHFGYMRFLQDEVPVEKVGVTISISSAVAYGPMLAVFGLVTGRIYDVVPESPALGYLVMAAAAFMGALCILPIVRRQPQSALAGG